MKTIFYVLFVISAGVLGYNTAPENLQVIIGFNAAIAGAFLFLGVEWTINNFSAIKKLMVAFILSVTWTFVYNFVFLDDKVGESDMATFYFIGMFLLSTALSLLLVYIRDIQAYLASSSRKHAKSHG